MIPPASAATSLSFLLENNLIRFLKHKKKEDAEGILNQDNKGGV
jgi:hypothetical protein